MSDNEELLLVKYWWKHNDIDNSISTIAAYSQLIHTTQAGTRNAAFPLGPMWADFKAAQNDLNYSETSVKSLKVCTRMNIVQTQVP